MGEQAFQLSTSTFNNNNTTVKVAADWAPDSASDWALDWASHSTVFNYSKVDYLNPFFWLLLRSFSL
jgi:hypothetical protein